MPPFTIVSLSALIGRRAWISLAASLMSLSAWLGPRSAEAQESAPSEDTMDQQSEETSEDTPEGEGEPVEQEDSKDEAPPSADFGDVSPAATQDPPPGAPPAMDAAPVESPPEGRSPSQPTQPALVGGAPVAPESKDKPRNSSTNQQTLVPRPARETQETSQTVQLPSPPLASEIPLDDEVDRRRELPGDLVARPLTLPEGTFVLAFSQGLVFIEGSRSGNSPAFSLGINEALEVGIDGALIYSNELDDWIGLQPQPHFAMTLFQGEQVELGTKLEATISTTSDTHSSVTLGVPILLRLDSTWRFDGALEVDLGFEEQPQVSVRVPLLARAQLARWLYAGVGAAAEFGPTGGRKTGGDAQLLLGLTYQTHHRAHLDFETEFFMENLGAGEDSDIGDGGGLFLRIRFYPELY